MLIKEIIQLIKEEYNKGVASDDSRLSNRFIYFKMLSVRNLLLKRKKNAKQQLSMQDVTDMCLKMKEVDGIDCCDFIGSCNINRSVKKIPKILSSLYGDMIVNVSGVNYKRKIFKIDISQLPYVNTFKYAKNTAKYFISDNYLYMIGKDLPEQVRLKAVLENPLDKINCDNIDTEESCKSYLDLDFPIDGSDVHDIVTLTVKEIFETLKNSKEDKINNTSNEN